MPTLAESLQGRDLGELRIIAELWGIELDAPDTRLAVQRLVPALLDRCPGRRSGRCPPGSRPGRAG